jgi:hypothetical protein
MKTFASLIFLFCFLFDLSYFSFASILWYRRWAVLVVVLFLDFIIPNRCLAGLILLGSGNTCAQGPLIPCKLPGSRDLLDAELHIRFFTLFPPSFLLIPWAFTCPGDLLSILKVRTGVLFLIEAFVLCLDDAFASLVSI